MIAFTIILPHLRNPGNDRALAICLDMLMANTVNDFTLLMDTRTDIPLHAIVNELVGQACTEAVVYWSSDMFPAPGWDVPMLALADEHTFVTNTLVEPGVIGVWSESIQKDFGRTPETFDRAGFEEYAKSAEVPNGEGWVAPVIYPRTGFLIMGGLTIGLPGDHHGFTSADMDLFERWRAAGNHVVRAHGSFAYHLQRWSQIDEQIAGKRA